MTSLVLCGGTGAHVALAFLRLHILGYPLGFFRYARSDRSPLEFPTLYLVDQDSGDGSEEATAWQNVRRLVDSHPARGNWHPITGKPSPPELKTITPLPIGHEGKWFRSPYDILGRRFDQSEYLDLLTSANQRNIRFSHGMMGSPAIGSLLFSLKQQDRRQESRNFDPAYHTLLQHHGRVAVVGSAVGGTGASVAPTLAQMLASQGANVMAIMVLNWFRFNSDHLDDSLADRAEHRQRSMTENANSAFAYYGQTLADHVATVPVGIPSKAIISRKYTSDTRQPACESFVHGVAALCCLHHYLASEPYKPGLYQMGSEDTTRLSGGNRLPGGGTVQTLANQALTFVNMLDLFREVLDYTYPPSRLAIAPIPAIYKRIQQLANPRRVATMIRPLVDGYREHIEWMRQVLRTEAQHIHPLTREHLSRAALRRHPFRIHDSTDAISAEDVALALFQWTANWVARIAPTEDGLLVEPALEVKGGYWPELTGDESLNVATERAGMLTKVAHQNVSATVGGFVQPESVSQNGWPHPLAAAEYFRYAIDRRDATARRQLALMLVGLMNSQLVLRDITTDSSHAEGADSILSLERLIDVYRKEHGYDFATIAVVYNRAGSEVVLGFNSPHTLLCAVPDDGSDGRLTRAWNELSRSITGSQRPEGWAVEGIDHWRNAARALRKIRTWLSDEIELHATVPPPWTQVFTSHDAFNRLSYGWARRLSVYWGAGGERSLVQVMLPAAKPGRGPGNGPGPPPFGPITEDQLKRDVPELWHFKDANETYDLTHFGPPGRATPIRVIWLDHIKRLQASRLIGAFKANPQTEELSIITANRKSKAVLDNILVLSRDNIMVRSCCPMQQVFMRETSSRSVRTLYPHFPVRSDFLGLLQLEDGQNVLKLLKKGKSITVPAPHIQGTGKAMTATWKVWLRGRSSPLSIKLLLPSSQVDQHRAHWMVWPSFRSLEAPHWRAYYVYEHCTDPRIHLRILWLDSSHDVHTLHRSEPTRQFGMRPIKFCSATPRRHQGGPPLAVSAQNISTSQELGLYLVPLRTLSRWPKNQEVHLGIDFGTSHTVASFKADGSKEVVSLAPERNPENADKLTLHLSENRNHVADPIEGLDSQSLWLPTYVKQTLPNSKGLVPSELLTIRPLTKLTASDVGRWIPGQDCVIPVMDVGRRDLAAHLLADFKWEVSFSAFRGQEEQLREIYLGMVTELVMADVVGRQLKALPSARVDFTFTYPLRSSAKEVSAYKDTLRRVVQGGTHSFGIPLGLTDGIGIYNESLAAKGGTERFGEVCLVGDLGGGTLDLFISANRGPNTRFEEVADSVRIGGNRLLRVIAEHADSYLPDRSGWSGETSETETKLRAWMRSLGAHRLFGAEADSTEFHPALNLPGFGEPSESNNARMLINRYFRLIEEYMSRSLVAFLARHWCPEVQRVGHDPNRLRVYVQLRGNGWRLWHRTADYDTIQSDIASNIQQRAKVLCEDPDLWEGGSDVALDLGRWGTGGADGEYSKSGPIAEAVGRALAHEEVLTYKHALAELHLLRPNDDSKSASQPARIKWCNRMPFDTGSDQIPHVEFRSVTPALPLGGPGPESRIHLSDLETHLKKRINQAIQGKGAWDGPRFSLPLAAIVWETAFRSRRFRESP